MEEINNFIKTIMEKDLEEGRVQQIVTRFPPEPNAYLHIGHARAIVNDFELAKAFGGYTNLRFDDTNPVNEGAEYVDAIIEDLKWLGYTPKNIFFGSDLLGYIAFDIKAYPLYPQITAIYALLGFASYFIFSLVSSIKSRKLMLGIEIVSLAAIWVAVSLFVILSNSITVMSTTQQIAPIVKILVPIISGLIFAGIIVFSVLYKGKDEKPVFSPLHICFASFICDFFIIVLFGSLMKALSFGTETFVAIILCQALVMFFNVMLDTAFISVFQKYTKKYFVEVHHE